jgi:hypothetical protein
VERVTCCSTLQEAAATEKQCGALREDGACCVAEPDHDVLLVAHHFVGGRNDLELANAGAVGRAA